MSNVGLVYTGSLHASSLQVFFVKEYQLLGDHDDARIVGFGLGKTGMRHKFDYSDKHPGYELTQTIRNLILRKRTTRYHSKISALIIETNVLLTDLHTKLFWDTISWEFSYLCKCCQLFMLQQDCYCKLRLIDAISSPTSIFRPC